MQACAFPVGGCGNDTTFELLKTGTTILQTLKDVGEVK